MKGKSLLLGLLAVLLSAGFAAAQDAAETAEAQEFVIAYSPRELALDPLHIYTTMESELCTAIYEGLLIPHPFTMEPMPGVAQHWEVSDDRRTYRFYLREGASYSNGDPVRAQDFLAAWMRFLDPEARAEYSFLFDVIKGAKKYRQGDRNAELGIRVVSDSILEVELEHPASHFLKLLTHLSFSPLHPRYIGRQNWDTAASIVGNGPFYIVRRTRDELLLRRNELYWDRRRVELATIRIRFLSDPAQISEEYNQGRVDWATNWDTSRLSDTSQIVFNPMFATSYFYFVSAQEPWKDARVRRALALLLPWEEIRSGDRLFESSRLIPPFSEYPEVKGIEKADPPEAFRLLEQAGYPNGQGLPPLAIKISTDSDSERIATMMAETWKQQLGLEVSIQAFEYELYLAEVKKADYMLGTVTWIGDYADPLTFLQMWTRESNLNDARYSSEEYERLIETAMTQEGGERYKTLAEAEKLLLDEAVVLPINHAPAFNLIDLTRIGGWYPNVLNVHPFKYFRFKKGVLPPGVAMVPRG
jgi:peptide/nickel transport system substrate-binding protein/oligopeptide transport system substrate-binding protein